MTENNFRYSSCPPALPIAPLMAGSAYVMLSSYFFPIFRCLCVFHVQRINNSNHTKKNGTHNSTNATIQQNNDTVSFKPIGKQTSESIALTMDTSFRNGKAANVRSRQMSIKLCLLLSCSLWYSSIVSSMLCCVVTEHDNSTFFYSTLGVRVCVRHL